MDEIWEAFEEVDRQYNNAYIADKEKTVVFCSYGEDIQTAFRKMADLIEKEKPIRTLAIHGDFIDEVYGLTVVCSNTDIEQMMKEEFGE